jgi:hypothetical protein
MYYLECYTILYKSGQCMGIYTPTFQNIIDFLDIVFMYLSRFTKMWFSLLVNWN